LKRSRFATLRVGLLIAAGIALFCFSIFYIGYGSQLMIRSGLAEARFHHTNGLLAGAPVSLNGVNVGAVSSIRFPRDPDADYVIVRMWIEDRAFARLRSDSTASIRTMGLLGDKYVEIGGGTKKAPRLAPGGNLVAQEPVDYEAMLQQPGAQDFVANITAISVQLRSLLESLTSRESLLGELINGEPGLRGEQLRLSDLHDGLSNIARLASDMDEAMHKLNNRDSLLGSMLAPTGEGRKMIANLNGAAQSMQAAAEFASVAARSLNSFAIRYGQGEGAMSRLFTDRGFGDEILANLRDSSADLRDILRKINRGQGTLGMAVNDPRLYDNANSFLASGPGWGIRLMSGFYSLIHPFAQSEPSFEPYPITAADADKSNSNAQSEVDP
jgi:phospholipid/cholesterol/gamma-HCH transport system substrate-binding protein